MDETCCGRKRLFKGTVYLAGIGGVRSKESHYNEEFHVEATSRKEAEEKIKQAALIFLMKKGSLELQSFTETTP